MGNRKQSPFDDLIGIAASLPWWVSLLLAGLTYLLIHPFASAPASAQSAANFGQLGSAVAGQIYRTVALFAQYLIPAGFVIGAGVSALERVKRKALLENTAKATSSETAKALSWREFEMLIGEMFRNKGYNVKETPKGPDGGVDLELRKAGELTLVQCKQWRATKVGVKVVRELFGVMAARGAVHGYVVTTGEFTPEAIKFAQGRNISLIDGQAVEREIRWQTESKSNVTHLRIARQQKREKNKWTPTTQIGPNELSPPAPQCPRCGNNMIQRVAKKGASAGKPFWGCSQYPKCHGTLPIK